MNQNYLSKTQRKNRNIAGTVERSQHKTSDYRDQGNLEHISSRRISSPDPINKSKNQVN